MARILLLLIIGLLIFFVLRALFRAQTGSKQPPSATPESADGEDMVACARCGVNVPRSETREVDGRRVCAQNPNCK